MYVRYESVVFLVMYAMYIILMYFNRHIEAWVSVKILCFSPSTELKPLKEIDSVVDFSEEEFTLDNNNELNNDHDDDNTSKLCLILITWCKAQKTSNVS